MNDIKTKDRIRGTIKTIDRASIASERIKNESGDYLLGVLPVAFVFGVATIVSAIFVGKMVTWIQRIRLI